MCQKVFAKKFGFYVSIRIFYNDYNRRDVKCISLIFGGGFCDMKESEFQRFLIGRIKAECPDAIVLKNDPDYIQGIPDLLILQGQRWAALECKRSESVSRRPNQLYWVEKMNAMSFAAFVHPENMENVLDQLISWFDSEMGGDTE